MRIIPFLALVAIVAVLLFYYFLYNAKNKLSFNFKLDNITSLDLSNINAVIDLIINNTNNFSFKFSNLSATIYYNNQVIAKTTSPDSSIITIAANSNTTIKHPMSFYINDASTSLLQNSKGQTINYDVSILAFGFIPYTVSGTYTI